MVQTFDVYNLVHYEAAKVPDEIQEVIRVEWCRSNSFSSGHYKKTMLGFEFHNICRATASEAVLTYLSGVSPIRTGVTHGCAHVISTMYTPRLLLVALFAYEIVK